MLFCVIGSFHDQLSCSMSMNGILYIVFEHMCHRSQVGFLCQPGFERYVDAVIEYRDLLYQFPDKDVIYLITSRHPYTHTRLCGPVHHGL